MKQRSLVVPLTLLALLAVACSTDTPTAPIQELIPSPGGNASTVWSLTVRADPGELTVGSANPATVTIRVREAATNQPPQSGTTLVVSTSLGEFSSAGSGTQTVALSTAGGFTSVLLFPGNVLGTAFVTAQLERSVGQAALPIVEAIEPVVASFDEQNSNENLSWQFQNTSTGNPTDFFWEFGDGATSTAKHPVHLYGAPGDYVVSLTASKTGSSDTTSKLLSVTNQEEEVVADFAAFPDGLNVLFQDLSDGEPTRWEWRFGDGASSTLQNPIHRYAGEGTFVVQLTAANSQSSDTVSKTVEVSLADELFITDIDPESGSASGGTTVTITGTGFVEPLRVFFGGVLGELVSVNDRSRIVVVTPPGVLRTESCDEDGDGVAGVRALQTAVTVTVELSTGTTEAVSGGFTFIPTASQAACTD